MSLWYVIDRGLFSFFAFYFGFIFLRREEESIFGVFSPHIYSRNNLRGKNG